MFREMWQQKQAIVTQHLFDALKCS